LFYVNTGFIRQNPDSSQDREQGETMNLELLLLLLVFGPIGVGTLLLLLPGKIKFIRELISFVVVCGACAAAFALFFPEKRIVYSAAHHA
jgi:ABC-type molybdate transport system permease subunit